MILGDTADIRRSEGKVLLYNNEADPRTALRRRSWGRTTTTSMILLHGSTSSADSWEGVAQILARDGWRIHAFDLPGHGESRAFGAEFHPRVAADRIIATHRKPVDLLVGHSLGALVALEIAAMDGQFAKGLVLEEPPGPHSVDIEAVSDSLAAAAAFARRDPEAALLKSLAHESWTAMQCAQEVVDLQRCDLDYVLRGLRRARSWRSLQLSASVGVPALLLLAPDSVGVYGAAEEGSALRGRDRAWVINALREPVTHVIGRGHCIHRDHPIVWTDHIQRFWRSLKLA